MQAKRIMLLASLAAAAVLAYVAVDRAGPTGPRPVLPNHAERLDASTRAFLDEEIARVRRDPSSARAHGMLGLAYETSAMWTEAEASFTNAEALDPAEPLWTLHRAIAIDQRDPAAALVLFEDVAQRMEGSASVQQRLGEALLANDRAADAERVFTALIQLAPERAEGWAGRGTARVKQRKHERAAEDLEKARELAPDYRQARYQLGLAYRELGRSDEARDELALGVGGKVRYLPDGLSSLKSELGGSYATQMQRAVSLLNEGGSDEALRILEKLAESRPKDVNVLNNLAMAYKRVAQTERALQLLRRVQELEESSFAACINVAGILMDLGRPGAALTEAERAVALAPDHRSTHLTHGQVLSRLGRLPEARAALARSLALGPTTEAHNLLGEASAAARDFEAAGASFEEALKLDPKNVQAHLNLCRLKAFRGDRTAAAAQLEEARKLAPDHPQVAALAKELGIQR